MAGVLSFEISSTAARARTSHHTHMQDLSSRLFRLASCTSNAFVLPALVLDARTSFPSSFAHPAEVSSGFLLTGKESDARRVSIDVPEQGGLCWLCW